ncbi:pyrroloquinoline quinone biosynthesis protein PqqB [Shewanella sp. D64]|uniref:MBL fold metallo-hydrolase n=1 Tax=unclassified Shewanella TaxID=196818 RepID=UPI0022BA6E1C|nr:MULTISPECIES: MBL fold metallo-hydrolase [unclassified Shewanella]MEC4728196.1 pyrroloquinoline quinone biosynthesis protein PqqB [Shewanella sp. D64]MEC4739993.1 pyrroloquinoline quinone biosynthesis protein PqqB [Shewanella sp. E94]WBJ94350.1 pyrroloquinoline quinone biosynthesis protein PqqB [Shewanella sp. MTB7]
MSLLRNVLMLITCTMTLNSFSLSAENKQPYLYILGVAQDAGYPQTGCYAEHCMSGWNDPQLRRGAVSLGLIDPAAHKKYMFEATPNFPEQLFELEKEAPNEQFEFSGLFITHAHIGHYSGLMFLGHEAMGATGVPVYAMPKMSQFLKSNGPWSQLVSHNNITLRPLKNNKVQVLDGIRITPFLVPHRDEYSETVGYRIEGPNRSALFIPDIDKWSKWKVNIADLIRTVDYALIDATFFANGELGNRDMSKVPHPFVSESMELFNDFSPQQKKKVWFIHFNHTNPLLNPDSKESQYVNSQGFNIAKEGIRLVL